MVLIPQHILKREPVTQKKFIKRVKSLRVRKYVVEETEWVIEDGNNFVLLFVETDKKLRVESGDSIIEDVLCLLVEFLEEGKVVEVVIEEAQKFAWLLLEEFVGLWEENALKFFVWV